MKHFNPFICDNFLKNRLSCKICSVLALVIALVIALATIFFSCLPLFFCVIKLKKFCWILTELNKTFT